MEHYFTKRIKGEANFIDFGDSVVLTDEKMDAVDAVIIEVNPPNTA